MTTKRKLTRHFDQVWGEDRYEHSPFKGEITEPVLLWKEPGQQVAAANVGGALAHGTFVQVLAKRMVGDAAWFKVKYDVQYEGKVWPQVGWVADRMLRNRGKGAFA